MTIEKDMEKLTKALLYMASCDVHITEGGRADCEVCHLLVQTRAWSEGEGYAFPSLKMAQRQADAEAKLYPLSKDEAALGRVDGGSVEGPQVPDDEAERHIF